jgi:hypothetical protein
MSAHIDFSFQKELRRDIVKLQQELERKQNILSEYNNTLPVLNPNKFEYLYFTDEIVTDRAKRMANYIRCENAQKIIRELKDMYNIDGILKDSHQSKPKMFAGLYIHYARWLGQEEEITAKLQVWKALEQYCIDLEFGQLTFGDIATIMGIIY